MNNMAKRVFNDGRDWFFEKRFGLFIHWGLYAINGLHEQEQQRYSVPAEQYVKLIDKFNPVKFNPDRWLDLAQEAGMEYLVLTAKHHDGFCLWDTKLTGFNVMNSPYKRDIVAMLAEACHRRGIKLEIYYSVVDWHHPAYPNIGRHHEISTDPDKHNWGKYMDFLKGQIRELCSNYGTIHGIWWDMNVPQHKDPSVHEMIRKLQPSALINNRGFDDGDYSTPERDFDPEGANPDDRAFKRPTEACQSVGVNSWGYRRNEDYFSVKYFQRNIAKTLAMGGNYLLNAGPDATGEFPPESVFILEKLGKWYKKVKEALTSEPAPGLIENRHVLTTREGDNIYIVCPNDLDSGTLPLRPLAHEPKEIVLMNTGERVQFTLEPTVYEMAKCKALRLRKLPVDRLNSEANVFKMIF